MGTSLNSEPERSVIGWQHPLLADLERLDRITKTMHVIIERVLFGGVSSSPERLLRNEGSSAGDVLQEAVIALLKRNGLPTDTTWEAYSAGIARNKAVDALRRVTAGRRDGAAPGDPDTIQVLSGDRLVDVVTGLPDTDVWADPEKAYELHEQQALLRTLVRELPEPDRTIVICIHFEGMSRVAVGKQVGLTGQRVGQILATRLRQLLAQLQQQTTGALVEAGLSEETS